MEKFLLLTVLISACFAEPKDLLGKAFVFSKENNRDHVKLLTNQTEFGALTVCLRFITDLTRNYGLFSLATPGKYNDFVLFKTKTEDVMRVHAQDAGTDFQSLSFPPNEWHSLCASWGSEKGLAQLWVDGKPSIKRFVTAGQPIRGKPSIILGQEQDTYGGGFDAAQCFIGMISNVHMWDRVLSTVELKRYARDSHFPPGNVFNWRSLNYDIEGQVYVEDEPEIM